MTKKIVIVGESGIDFLPDSEGSIQDTENFSRKIGGSAVNAAIGLANLGIPPLLHTRVGDDPFGKSILSVLDKHGVPLDYVESDTEAMTSLAFVQYDTDSTPHFTFYRHETADTRLQPGKISPGTLAEVEWVHVTGVLLASESSRSALLSLMEEARDADCQISFNPNTRPQLWEDTDSLERDINDALELADVVIATPEDFELLGMEVDDPTNLATTLCDRGPHSVFLSVDTTSAYGLVTEGLLEGSIWHDGYHVEPVYPVGETDAFTAGIIASLISDATSLEEVIKSANAVSTLSTMSPGAITAFSLNRSVQSLYSNPPWLLER
jgi:fructokinase